MRSGDADFDEALVRRHALRLALPLRVVDAGWRTPPAGNLQARARELRRHSLEQAQGVDGVILLGHQAWDQSESILAALAKGKAPGSWTGMSPREGAWLRPLLGLPADWIRRRCRDLRLEWREDASNQATPYDRNLLRHHWLAPLRGIYGPEPDLLLARLAENMCRVALEWQEVAGELLDNLDLRPNEIGWSLERAPFLPYHEAGVREALRLLGRRLGLWARDPSTALLDRLAGFIQNGHSGARHSLGPVWMAEAGRDRLWLTRGRPEACSATLEPGRRTPLGSLEAGWCEPEGSVAHSWRPLATDARARVEIRRWRPGDKLRTGPAVRRSLADLMGERGFAPSQKLLQWVVTVDEAVCWCPGLAEAWRPDRHAARHQHAIWVDTWPS